LNIKQLGFKQLAGLLRQLRVTTRSRLFHIYVSPYLSLDCLMTLMQVHISQSRI